LKGAWLSCSSTLAGVVCALACLQNLAFHTLRTGRYVQDPVLGPVRRSGSCEYRLEGWAASHWLERGLRHSGNPPLKGRPEARILVLGDSFVEAMQVNDREVFSSQAERDLRASGWKVEMLNASRAERSVADLIARSEAFIKVFQPDWVVVLVSAVDLERDSWMPDRIHFERKAERLVLAGRDPDEPLPANAQAPISAAPGWQVWLDELPYRWGFSHLSNLILWRRHEFAARWANQPPLFRAAEYRAVAGPSEAAPRYPLEEELEWLNRSFHGRLSLLFVPQLDRFQGPLPGHSDRRIVEECRRRGLSLLDASADLQELWRQGRPPAGFFNSSFNQGHFNRHGHRALASTLARGLQELRARGVL